jgi:hypothetical protein
MITIKIYPPTANEATWRVLNIIVAWSQSESALVEAVTDNGGEIVVATPADAQYMIKELAGLGRSAEIV